MDAQSKTCLMCGRSFELPVGGKFDLCPECLKKSSQRYAEAPETVESSSELKKSLIPWVVCAVCAAIVFARLPGTRKALALLFPPPPEAAHEAADARGLCLTNLWIASSLIQGNRWPSETLACPATRKPYRTTTPAGDLTVSCPNPGDHGLKGLRVSKSAPTPEELR